MKKKALSQELPQLQHREVTYDDYSAPQFCTRMQEEGFPMVNYGATVKNFNEPTKLLEALNKAGSIHHNGDPVLAWMMSNVIGHFDGKDNVFPVKDEHQRGNNMTDGAIALIMALARAMVAPVESRGSDLRIFQIGDGY